MMSWFRYLKRGLSRTLPQDRVSPHEGDKGARDLVAYLRPFIANHWRKGVLGATLILTNSILSFPQPLLNRYLIDHIILPREMKWLPWVVLSMVMVKVFSGLSDSIQQYFFTRFEQNILLDIQGDLFQRVLRLPKAFFDQKETGYLMSRLSTDVNGLRFFFSRTMVDILSNTLTAIGGIGLLIYLEWRLALVSLLIVPLLVTSMRYFSQKYRVLSHQDMEQQANVSRVMQETLSASTLIKAFSSEQHETDKVLAELEGSYQIRVERTVVGSLANLAIGSIGDIAKVIVLLTGAYLVIVGDWTLGSMLAFQSYLGYVYNPARFLATTNLQLQNALAAMERISSFNQILPEEDQVGRIQVAHLRGEIEFKNVSFSYGDSTPVLHEVSFLVRPGECVAVVGPSGVGKTTLISLLLRFYNPTNGEIWFDGLPAAAYQLRALRQRIGYVSQGTLLLSGSIHENLVYGNKDASRDETVQAAQVAGIHEFILQLPDGYESRIGEGGVNLSEGQKQRLAIARALIKSPDILVLDEPTSALDSIVERTIFDRLPSLVREKTIFIVSHRLSTIQNSNRILLLNENRLVAMGTHQELWGNNDYYRSLIASQQVAPR